MRLIALLALCVLHAHSATIKVPEKKLDDLDNVDLDNVVSEPELVDSSNSVKDIDNNLRNVLGIPVKVIEEPVKKLDENSNDYVPDNDDSINLKRQPVDLRNPGPPQRQEHETQNPEHYSDAQKAIFAIKQTIEDTQNVFTKGLKGISESFNNLFANNEQLTNIQQNIQSLRITFNEQVSKLNNTIKSYINPDKDNEAQKELSTVETRLRALETNFKTGVNTLSEGVELLAIIKEEDEATAKAEGEAAAAAGKPPPSSTTQAPFNQNNNPIYQFLYNFQQGIVGSFTNLNNAVQGYFNQGQTQPPNQAQNQGQANQQNDPAAQPQQPVQGGNFITNLFQGIQLPFSGQQASQQGQNQAKPPGAAADEQPAQQVGWRPPNIVQSLQNSWNNIVNPNQNQQQSQQTQQTQQNPISQAFQNIVNVFNRPNQTPQNGAQAPQNGAQSPTAAVNTDAGKQPVASDVQQGVNAVPANENSNAAPEAAQVPQPAKPAEPQQTEPAKQTGPIRQLVQNNPIIKGIQTVAHRITNPERPREDNVDTKGHGGWGNGNNGNNGDNSDSNGIKSQTPEKEGNIEKAPVESDKTKEKVTEESQEPAKTE